MLTHQPLKNGEGCFFKLYDQSCLLLLHSFAGDKIKGHALPAPVVNIKFEHGKGWRPGTLGYTFFRKVALDLIIAKLAFHVLAENNIFVLTTKGEYGFKEFHLLIANGIGTKP